jgi:hypothetical protein
MPCFICFLFFQCNKKGPKNESPQNVLKIWYDFFLNFWELLVQITSEGGAPGGQHPPGRATPPWRGQVGVGPLQAPLTYPFSLFFPLLQKPTTIAFFPVFLLPNLRFLISLLGAPFSKLFWRIATWYVTPPLVQLVFLLVVYILST